MIDPDKTRERSIVFVSILFALVVEEIAIRAVDLQNCRCELALSGYAHLILALGVVAASWIGWTISWDDRLAIRKVFSLPSLVLLVDLAVVYIYFELVKSSEYCNTDLPCKTVETQATAIEEVRGIAYVFSAYIVWDILFYVLISNPVDRLRTSKFQRMKNEMANLAVSFACLVLTIAAGWIYLNFADHAHHISVIFVDAALLLLVLFFRSGKQWVLSTGRQRTIGKTMSVSFLALYLGCLIGASCIS